MKRLLVLLSMTLGLIATSPCRAGQLELTWFTIDSGGGLSGGGDYLLDAAIGQPDVGASSGSAFSVTGGFFAPAIAPSISCSGDINASGAVDVGDLIEIVVNWGLCLDAPCPADPNDDGEVNVQDLILVVVNWGPCP